MACNLRSCIDPIKRKRHAPGLGLSQGVLTLDTDCCFDREPGSSGFGSKKRVPHVVRHPLHLQFPTLIGSCTRGEKSLLITLANVALANLNLSLNCI